MDWSNWLDSHGGGCGKGRRRELLLLDQALYTLISIHIPFLLDLPWLVP